MTLDEIRRRALAQLDEHEWPPIGHWRAGRDVIRTLRVENWHALQYDIRDGSFSLVGYPGISTDTPGQLDFLPVRPNSDAPENRTGA